MNRTQLIDSVTQRTRLDRLFVESVILSTIETIKDTVASGEMTEIHDFGSFIPKIRKSKIGNLHGKQTEIPERCQVKFKPHQDFKGKMKKLKPEIIKKK